MKRGLYSVLASLMVLTAIAACKKNETPKTVQEPAAAQPAATQRTGTVVETVNTGNYTYVQVDTGSEKVWAAAPAFQVKVGDKVIVPQGMVMKDYHSQTLNRTFDQVYFVSNITVVGAEKGIGAGQASGQMPQGHPQINPSDPGASAQAKVDISGIEKPAGGKTVAELFAEKAKLSGKEVRVRGKVVKFSSGIMGKNWIHLEDGSGAKGANNLTITTNATAKVGDKVLVSGMVVTDKDFGYGYHYDVILEDAIVTVE